jgi:hypothetical protein
MFRKGRPPRKKKFFHTKKKIDGNNVNVAKSKIRGLYQKKHNQKSRRNDSFE